MRFPFPEPLVNIAHIQKKIAAQARRFAGVDPQPTTAALHRLACSLWANLTSAEKSSPSAALTH
jgi:hypothetical protein